MTDTALIPVQSPLRDQLETVWTAIEYGTEQVLVGENLPLDEVQRRTAAYGDNLRDHLDYGKGHAQYKALRLLHMLLDAAGTDPEVLKQMSPATIVRTARDVKETFFPEPKTVDNSGGVNIIIQPSHPVPRPQGVIDAIATRVD